jgi:uncharacterized membrane protein YphA (DoxX/SURF4 family)
MMKPVKFISLLFALLFLYTGISKIVDYAAFKEQIAASPLLASFSGPVAWLLPRAELIVVLLLIIPRWRMRGLYASFVLLLLFTGYIVMTFNFSEYTDCGCGGFLDRLSPWAHITLNLVFVALAGIGIWLNRKTKKEGIQVYRPDY